MELENQKIEIEKNGKIVKCDVLFTFDCEDTLKSYIGYTDHSIGTNGRKNVYVSSYNPLNPKLELEDIEDPRELDMINEVLIKFDEETNKE